MLFCRNAAAYPSHPPRGGLAAFSTAAAVPPPGGGATSPGRPSRDWRPSIARTLSASRRKLDEPLARACDTKKGKNTQQGSSPRARGLRVEIPAAPSVLAGR